MTDLPLYRATRDKTTKELLLEPFMRAYGKEKRVFSPQEKDDDPVPRSKYQSRKLSEVAKNLFRAIYHEDDYKAKESEERVVAHLAENIRRWAIAQKWKVGNSVEGSEAMAKIALYPRVHGKLLTDEEAAKVADVSRAAFQKSWKPKLPDFDPWLSSWVAEFDD